MSLISDRLSLVLLSKTETKPNIIFCILFHFKNDMLQLAARILIFIVVTLLCLILGGSKFSSHTPRIAKCRILLISSPMSLKLGMRSLWLWFLIIFKTVCMNLDEKFLHGVKYLKGGYFKSQYHIPKSHIQVSNNEV